MIPPMRKTNEASLFSYNGESINEGEQRKAAVAVAVAAVVTVELQIFLMAAELCLCIVNGDVAPTRRPYRTCPKTGGCEKIRPNAQNEGGRASGPLRSPGCRLNSRRLTLKSARRGRDPQ